MSRRSIRRKQSPPRSCRSAKIPAIPLPRPLHATASCRFLFRKNLRGRFLRLALARFVTQPLCIFDLTQRRASKCLGVLRMCLLVVVELHHNKLLEVSEACERGKTNYTDVHTWVEVFF